MVAPLIRRPRYGWRHAVAVLLLGAMVLPVQAQLRVRDDLGREISIPAPARRIVSLGPHLTEMLFAIGAGNRTVGVVDYSNYPPQAREVPRVGSSDGFDLEAILALQPDLVLAWSTGNPAAQVAKLQRLGLPVYVSEPRRLEDIPHTLQRLGVLTGNSEAAREVAEQFLERLASLRRRYGARPTVNVFYEIWHQPLVTLNGEHLVSHILELCGGRNVFADLAIIAPHVGIEDVLAADPEVIIASGGGRERPEWLDEWRRWGTLSAVAHDNLFSIPPDIILRHSPRIVEGVEIVCEVLETARERRGQS